MLDGLCSLGLCNWPTAITVLYANRNHALAPWTRMVYRNIPSPPAGYKKEPQVLAALRKTVFQRPAGFNPGWLLLPPLLAPAPGYSDKAEAQRTIPPFRANTKGATVSGSSLNSCLHHTTVIMGHSRTFSPKPYHAIGKSAYNCSSFGQRFAQKSAPQCTAAAVAPVVWRPAHCQWPFRSPAAK